MAGIEKVCEISADGHWPNVYTIRKYNDNIQVCAEHMPDLQKQFAGKPHRIKVYKSDGDYSFELHVEGVGCPYTEDDYWYRWFYDKRKWKRNMRKLLGVRRLNIIGYQS